MKKSVKNIIEKYNKDKGRLMDMLLDIHEEHGYLSKEYIAEISNELEISEVDVIQTASFCSAAYDIPIKYASSYLASNGIATKI